MGRLTDRVIAVTGAAHGIGAAVARGIAAEGARVACIDLDDEGARAMATELPDAVGMGCDVTDYDQVERAFANVVEWAGHLDGLVNNVGGSQGGATRFLELEPAAWHRMIDRNLTSAFYCSLVAARHIVASRDGGAMVLISSQLSVVARPGLAHYAASKGGVAQLVRGMAVDLAPHRIRVNAVAPGPTITPGTSQRFSLPEVEEELARSIPLGRPGRPAELAGAVVHLLGDEASYTTGATLFVDGGYTIV